jgi:FHS family L-fucose permease-like MFS transporter
MEKQGLTNKEYLIPFILITSLFFLWGLANNMTDTLLAAFKRIMSMTDSKTALIQVVCYGAGYGLFAIPAAIFIKKYTYKTGVLLGLGMYALGAILFYPAMLSAQYGWFLAAIWVLFSGLSILETAANPYIITMGPEETGTRRLNLAQSFNPIGSITGVFISQYFILSQLNRASAAERALMSQEKLQKIQAHELSAVTMTYVSVGLILLVIWILIAINKKMPNTAEGDKNIDLIGTFRRIIKKKHYIWGVIAQFFYVGAQIGVWSFTIRYVMQELKLESITLSPGKTPEQIAASYYTAALILFTASRFICTWLMKYIKPAVLLRILAIIAIILSAIVALGGGKIGVYALVGISGTMSLMFPTIFGLAVRGLGEDTKIAGSGLIMAILGGAIITQIQGIVSTFTGNINISYLIPLLCFVVITIYSIIAQKYETN